MTITDQVRDRPSNPQSPRGELKSPMTDAQTTELPFNEDELADMKVRILSPDFGTEKDEANPRDVIRLFNALQAQARELAEAREGSNHWFIIAKNTANERETLQAQLATANGEIERLKYLLEGGVDIVRSQDAELTTLRAQITTLTAAPSDGMRGLDTETRVRFYEHDFYPLSNFSAFNLMWRDIRFDTSEAAYHYEKFPGEENLSVRSAIRRAPSAHEAFKIAERAKDQVRADWKDVRIGIMRNILRQKAAQHEYVTRKLLATGDRELVEDSWRDDFWGWGPNRDGQNMLGKLWMEIRTEITQVVDGRKA